MAITDEDVPEYTSLEECLGASGIDSSMYPSKTTRSALRELAEACAINFLYRGPAHQNSFELAAELRCQIDYAPVMGIFLERELDRVTYEHEHDSFLFTFKTPPSAIEFSRRNRSWNTIDRKGLEQNREVFDIARKKIFGENERGLSTSGHTFPSRPLPATHLE